MMPEHVYEKLIKWVKETTPNYVNLTEICDEHLKILIDITYEATTLKMGEELAWKLPKKIKRRIFKNYLKTEIKISLGRVRTRFGPEDEKFVDAEKLLKEGYEERKLINELIKIIRYL
jgi:hypothetical protein